MFHFDYKKSRKRYKTQPRKREAERTQKNQEERLTRAQGSSLGFVAVTGWSAPEAPPLRCAHIWLTARLSLS